MLLSVIEIILLLINLYYPIIQFNSGICRIFSGVWGVGRGSEIRDQRSVISKAARCTAVRLALALALALCFFSAFFPFPVPTLNGRSLLLAFCGAVSPSPRDECRSFLFPVKSQLRFSLMNSSSLLVIYILVLVSCLQTAHN